MSISDIDASHEKVKEQTNELRTKYPIFTAILERIPDMDLKEVVSVLELIDPVRSVLSVLRTHATRLSFIGRIRHLIKWLKKRLMN